jgi:sugar lactone lactonase YvrE
MTPLHHRTVRPAAAVLRCLAVVAAVAGMVTGAFADETSAAPRSEKLFVATPLTQPGEFTDGIEGPACDAQGTIYAVNYRRQGTIGAVAPDGRGEIFVTLPEGSVGNGIVFDRAGTMFVADYTNHNVLAIDPATRRVRTFAHEARMSQPNDLAIAPDGTMFASDPDWRAGKGRVWRVDRKGGVTLVADNQGTSNGIEVSPDGRSLYVNESDQRNIWRFTITADNRLVDRKRIARFKDHGFDGMRCDEEGNLYVSRIGAGLVIKLTPAGRVLREISVLGKRPSNLCFGGPDGRTVYVTEVEHTRLVSFRVDRPGLAWRRWQEKAAP